MHSIVIELVIIVGFFIIAEHILHLPSFGFSLCVMFVKLLIKTCSLKVGFTNYEKSICSMFKVGIERINTK